MNIIKRQPTSNEMLTVIPNNSLWSLRDAMNRLFDESFWSPLSLMDTVGNNRFISSWPRVDIAETDEGYTITANVPDVDPDKINIEVTSDSIALSGAVERSQEHKDAHWHRMEREYGEFHREFTLPHMIDPDSVKATAKNGSLRISLKKKEDSGRKKITVATE